MSSWLANITQAVQDRLESLVDDGIKPESSEETLDVDPSGAAVRSVDEVQQSSEYGVRGAAIVSDASSVSDLMEQLAQQRSMIEQLRELIREKESENFKYEKRILEASGSCAYFDSSGKHVGSSEEGGRSAVDTSSVRHDVGEMTALDTIAASRGKALQLKKQLHEKSHEHSIKVSSQERIIEELRLAVHAKEDIVRELQKSAFGITDKQTVSAATSTEQVGEEVPFSNDVRSVAKKDAYILELHDHIQELDQTVMSLQELVSEKDEVICGRDKAIKLFQEQLATNASLSRHLDDSRALLQAEFTSLQERFATSEEAWLGERATLHATLAQYNTAYTQMTAQCSEMQQRLAASSIDRNGARTTGHVSAALPSTDASGLEVENARLSSCLEARDQEIADLKKTAAEQSGKLLKVKAQALAKVKALQKDLEEFKKATVQDPSVSLALVESLRNQVAEIEEEKGNLQLQLVDLDEVKTAYASSLKELAATKTALESAQADGASLHMALEDARRTVAQLVQDKHLADTRHTQEALTLKDSQTCLARQLQDTIHCIGSEKEAASQAFSELHTRLKDLEMEAVDLRSAKLCLVADLAQARSMLVEQEADLDSRRDCKVAAEVKMAELEETRDDLLREKAEQAAVIENLRAQAVPESIPLNGAADSYAASRHTTESQAAVVEGLTRLVSEQKEEVALLIVEQCRRQLENNELAQSVAQLQDQLQRMERQTAGAEQELERCRLEAARWLEQQGVRVQALDGERLALMHTLEQKEAQWLRQEQSHREAEAALRELLDHEKAQVTERLRRQDEAMEQGKQQWEEATQHLKLQMEVASQCLEQQRKEAAQRLQRQMEEAARCMEQQEEQLQLAGRQRDDLDGLLEEQRGEVVRLLKQLEEQSVSVLQQEAQVELLREQQSVAAALLLEQQREVMELTLKVDAAEQSIEQYRQHSAAAQQQHDKAVSTLKQRQEETIRAIQQRLEEAGLSLKQQEQQRDLMQQQHEEAVSIMQQRCEDAEAACQLQQQQHRDIIMALQQHHEKVMLTLESKLLSYTDSHHLLTEQLQVMLDEKAKVTDIAAQESEISQRDLLMLRLSIKEQLVHAIGDSFVWHPADEQHGGGGSSSMSASWVQLCSALKQQHSPATVEEAVAQTTSFLSAMRDVLLSYESQLSQVEAERDKLVAQATAKTKNAAQLPPALQLRASLSLPADSQPPQSGAGSAEEWCHSLLSEVDRLRSALEHTVSEFELTCAKHREKLAFLTSNLQEVECQLSTSMSECDSLRFALDESNARLSESSSSTSAAQQAASAAQQAAAAEREATLRKYAAVIKKLKGEVSAAKEASAALVGERSIFLAHLHKTVDEWQARGASTASSKEAVASRCDDSGLDMSMTSGATSDNVLEQFVVRLSDILRNARRDCWHWEEVAEKLESEREELRRQLAVQSRQFEEQVEAIVSKKAESERAEQRLQMKCTELQQIMEAAEGKDDVERSRLQLVSSDLYSQLHQHQARSKKLDEQLAQTALQLDEHRACNKQLNEQLAQAALQLDENRAHNKQLNEQLAQAVLQLDEHRACNKQLNEQLALTALQLDEHRACNEQYSKDMAATALQLNEWRAANEHLHEELATKALEAQEERVANGSRTLALEAEVGILAAKVNELSSCLTNVQRESCEAQQLLTEALNQKKHLDLRLHEASAQMESLARSAADISHSKEMEAANDSASAQLAAANARMDKMLVKLKQFKDKNDSLQSSLDATSAKLSSAVFDGQAKCNSLQAEARRMSSVLREAEAQLSNTEKDLAEERHLCVALRAEREGLVARCRSDGEVAAGERASWADNVARLSAEKDQALGALASLRQEVSAADSSGLAERRRLSVLIDSLKAQALEEQLALKRQAAEAEERSDRARLEVASVRSALEEEKNSLQRRLAETSSQYSMLEADNREFERLVLSLQGAKDRLKLELREAHKRAVRLTNERAESELALNVELGKWQHRTAELEAFLSKETPQFDKEKLQRGAPNECETSSSEQCLQYKNALALLEEETNLLKSHLVTAVYSNDTANDAWILHSHSQHMTDDIASYVRVLQHSLENLRCKLAELERESVKEADTNATASMPLLQRLQLTEFVAEQRQSECRQLLIQVRQLSESERSLIEQFNDAMASLRHAEGKVLDLQQQISAQPVSHAGIDPSLLANTTAAISVKGAQADFEGELLSKRVMELETACRCFSEDICHLQQQLCDAQSENSILRDVHLTVQERASQAVHVGGYAAMMPSSREHSVYIANDASDSTTNDVFGRSPSSPLASVGMATVNQMPFVQRGGEYIGMGIAALQRAFRRRQSCVRVAERFVCSLPSPRLLFLVYMLLVHVLLLGASLGNWFCP